MKGRISHILFTLAAVATLLAVFCVHSNAQVIANDDDFLVNENEVWTGNLGENDALPAGQPATYSVVTAPLNGTFTFTTGGNFAYTPPLNLFGFRDSVYYQVCVNGNCDIAGVEFYVIFRNTVPFAGADFFSVEFNTPRTGDVSLNDGDPDSITDPIDTSLDWFKFTNPTNGIVNNFNINGAFTYTPNSGFTGTDSFKYYVVDHCGLYAIADVFLTIVAPNSNPTAGDQTFENLNEDTAFNGSLTSLVSDPENDPITYSVLQPPSSGTLQLSSGGAYSYTPAPNFTGTVSFTYNACDLVGQCDQGTITLTIINTDNDPPQLQDDNFILNEDATALFNASLNDYDDTGALSYTLLSPPTFGVASLVGSPGQFVYTPAPNSFGIDSLFLQVCDGLQCSTSGVRIQINAINDPPIASPFSIVLNEDAQANGTISTITDADNSTLVFSTPGGNSISGLTINSNGSFSYAPPANYFGTQTITIQGCDQQNLCASTSFTIQVNSVNDLPIVFNDLFSANEDQPISGNLSGGESDAEGSALTYSTTSNAANGTWSLSPNGQFTYVPNANWSGTETFNISVCDNQNGCSNSVFSITINSVNDTPIALPASLSTQEDNPLSGNLSMYASDVENAQLNYTILNAPALGTFNLNNNGTFTFVPALNFFGSLTAAYQACDNGGACSVGSITISVTAINDAPTAPNLSITLNEDQTTAGSINGLIDVDNSSLLLSILQNTEHGTFGLTGNGNYTYSPEANFNGTDMVIYTACDAQNACDQGTITFNVLSIQDSPVVLSEINSTTEGNPISGDVSSNDSDGDGDILTYTNLNTTANGQLTFNGNGTYSYLPVSGFIGTETVTYFACDSQNNCNSATLTIIVLTSNTAPTATNSAQSTLEDISVTGNLADVISDAEGGPYTYSTLVSPSHGELTWNANGTYTYAPESNYYGADIFTFEACDAGGLCTQAEVAITINAANDAPLLGEDLLYAFEDYSFTYDIHENDLDIENNSITYALTGNTVFAAVELSPEGIFTMIPVENYFGTFYLPYEACDDAGACTSDTLAVIVREVWDAPMASPLFLITTEDSPLSGTLYDAVSDVDSDTFFFGIVANPNNGSISLENQGNFTYAPEANFTGNDAFIYYAADMGGLYDFDTIFIQVNPVNDAPLLVADSLMTEEDNSITFNLSSNDSDAENDAFSYSLSSIPQLGEAILEVNGTITFTPFTNVFGADSIQITACDIYNACTSGYAFIEISPVNDAPFGTPSDITGQEDTALTGDLNGMPQDIEDGSLHIIVIDSVENGIWTLTDAGSYSFLPDANYFGTQTLNYQACDSEGACTAGQFSLIIEPVNDPPQTVDSLFVLSEDSATQGVFNELAQDAENNQLQINITQDVEHGTFVLNPNGSFVYAATANFFGMDSLIYNACDEEGLCTSGTIYFDVTFVNDLPIAVNEGIQVIMNTSTSGSVASNDVELDFEPLVYSLVEDFSGGVFILNTDGTFSYTPAADTTGLFTVSYAACDPCNACDYGTITLYVVSENEANTPPIASDYLGEVCQGASITVNLSNSIFDAEDANDDLQLSFGTTNSGSYQLDPETNELIYQSAGFTTGEVVIPYYVCDAGIISMCDTAFIVLTVLPSNNIDITGFSTTQISCYGANDGFISIEAQTASGTLTYTWSNGENTQSLEQLAPGMYTLILSSDASCPVNQTAQFEIFEPAELLASHEISIDSIHVTITGGTPTYSIVWNTPSGIVLNESIIAVEGEGTYTYTITDAHDCEFSQSVQITGVLEREAFTTQVFPNPISNEGTLRIHSSTFMTELELLDSKGALIQRTQPNSKNASIITSDWAKGIYLLRIHSAQGIVNRRVIKQ